MTAAVTTVPRARWYRVGPLLFLIYLVGFMERTNIAIAVPGITEDLALSAGMAGVVLSAFFWGYVLTQIPGGWVADRIGPRVLVCVALVIWGITSVLTGLADSVGWLIVLRVLLGLAEGVVWPAFTVLISRWFPAGERGRATNLSLLALPASAVVAAPLGGWMIDVWNWQTMFVLQGLPPFVLAAVAWWLLRDDPADDPLLATSERDYILAHRSSARAPKTSLLRALTRPAVLVLALVYFLWLTGFYSFGLWLPTIVDQMTDTGIGMVGLLSAIPFVIAMGAMVVNARASDKSRRSTAYFIVVPFVIGGIGLIVGPYISEAVLPQFLLLTIVGIGVYAAFGPWWGWVIRHAPANQTGPVNGLVNLGGNFGGVAGPVMVGAAAAGGAAVNGLYILGFFMIAAAVLATVLALRGTDRHTQAEHTGSESEQDAAIPARQSND